MQNIYYEPFCSCCIEVAVIKLRKDNLVLDNTEYKNGVAKFCNMLDKDQYFMY